MAATVLAGTIRAARSLLARTQSTSRDATNGPPGTAGHGLSGLGIDLGARPSPYVQPDRTTCGSSCLVLARMINHPHYARTLLDSPTGHPPGVAARFRAESLAMHELTNSLREETGRRQLPWPKALGTQPWALARRMGGTGGCGVSGSRYAVRYCDPARTGAHLEAITAALDHGHCVPIYLGDQLSPRHVVLALDHGDDGFGLYDPSRGARVTVARADVHRGHAGVAGWDQLWLSVLPRL